MSKTFIVTGGNRGLGLEFVRQLAAKGEKVIATARNVQNAQDLAAFVDNKSVFAVALDTADSASVKSAFAEISRIAPEGIDVLINNSGITGERGSFESVNPDDFTHVFKTNVTGTFDVTQQALPLLRKKDTRIVFNISSILGSIEYNLTGGTGVAYSVSKAAENMLVKSLANGLKNENFTIVAVHPGWVRTSMGGAGADIDATESISGMLEQLYALTPAKNGAFFDYQGKTLPW
ncbi:4-dihydrotrisporin dehydrogenase [Gongronella butleri]|nr:4-dihydrotrisporin dehydrogenase [Gongronella butleri]